MKLKSIGLSLIATVMLVGCGGGDSKKTDDYNQTVNQIIDGKNITVADFSHIETGFTLVTSAGDIHPGSSNDGDVVVVGHELRVKSNGSTEIIQLSIEKTIMGADCNITGRTGDAVEFFCKFYGDIGGDGNTTFKIYDGIDYEIVQTETYIDGNGGKGREKFIVDFPKL